MTTIVDWELSLKLAGNDSDHAKNYLILLTKDLNKRIEKLAHSMNHHEYDHMKLEVHQIIGALSYSGAIRLKKSAENLYIALKNNSSIHESLIKFYDEVKLFVEYTAR